MPTSPELAQLAARLYPEDLTREYQRESAANFGAEPSPAQIEAAVNRVVVAHAADLHRAYLIAQGDAVNADVLPAGYRAKLAKLNVDDAAVEAVARFAAPGVSRAEALRTWQQKAERLEAPNPRKAADPHASKFYDPNYDVPRESNE